MFGLNPRVADVNTSRSDCAKHCVKVTEELPTKDKLQALIANSPSVKNHFDNFRSNYFWGLLLTKITDDDDGLKDVIKNHRAITNEKVVVINDSYLGNTLLETHPDDQLLFDFNPATDATHK